jgi:CCR4-NOT transcription complex subunit 1
VDGALKAKQIRTQIDECLMRPEGSLFLTDLKQKLLLTQNEANIAGTRYNVPLVNSLVLLRWHAGCATVAAKQGECISTSTN